MSEVERASKKLSAKDLTGKRKKPKRDTREDQILDQQKEAAIAVIKESSKFDRNVDLVRDDSYNNALKIKIDSVELKIDQLDLIFT